MEEDKNNRTIPAEFLHNSVTSSTFIDLLRRGRRLRRPAFLKTSPIRSVYVVKENKINLQYRYLCIVFLWSIVISFTRFTTPFGLWLKVVKMILLSGLITTKTMNAHSSLLCFCFDVIHSMLVWVRGTTLFIGIYCTLFL